MSIIELLQKVGAENILVQNVTKCADQIDYSKKKGGCTVKFFTDQIQVADLMSTDGFSKVGLVVWFDRNLLPKSE